jgi:hypothetical protein
MHDDHSVRTTLDLDPDVLQAAKELAASSGTTAGRVISDLVRKALQPAETPQIRNGVPLMPRRPPGSPLLTSKMVADLLDEE